MSQSCKNSMKIEPSNVESNSYGTEIVLEEWFNGRAAKRVRIVGDDYILENLAWEIRRAVNRRVAYLNRRIEDLRDACSHGDE